ncbi:FAS-associated factor 1 [Agrilus planipennis]|uniref:FAS-associated factor 1 n=1 Tax=Agrilus planipennis TaxID=224129 RepID=A0A1W4XDD2_AGRPL|nr:FAS-associated factor 1 [Agrilus planipennis]
MAANREEILADFQACTGIDDIAVAIHHLEETEWDLVRAVNRVMPQASQSFNDMEVVDEPIEIPVVPVETATDMVTVGNNVGHPCAKSMPFLENDVESHSSTSAQPSTSLSKVASSRTLQFDVKYCDRVISLNMPETSTIADLKIKLHRELKIPPCRQLLSGWARIPQYEKSPFSELMLPDKNTLFLSIKLTEGGLGADEEPEVTERLNGTYRLKVTDETTGKVYFLNYSGTKTILDVKTGVYTLTDIQVRNQVWSGWPPNIDDRTTLALSGINYPEHELKLRRSTIINHVREKKSNIIEIDSDDDEFEDASETFTVDDDMFVDNYPSKRVEPLIPEDVEDEIIGTITFSDRFTARYGPVHPSFYQGTLEDALKEACQKSAKDRKILAVYLHHDASVLTNVFCTQLLGCESVIQNLETNFILWAWDLTFESNRTKLQESVSRCLGSTAALSLKTIPVDRLPAIVLIMKIRSSTDVFSVIHGNVGVNELLISLIEAVEVFSEHQKVEIREEDERAARELVKWEQDQAYRESLEADRAKEEAKRLQEEAEKQKEKQEALEKAEEAAKREAHRKTVEASLPLEPAQNESDITKIRFRLPGGQNIERRFLGNDPLQVLLDFLLVKGYPQSEYKVISSWPRRDLTALESGKTLKQLKLYPQETVILEER